MRHHFWPNHFFKLIYPWCKIASEGINDCNLAASEAISFPSPRQIRKNHFTRCCTACLGRRPKASELWKCFLHAFICSHDGRKAEFLQGLERGFSVTPLTILKASYLGTSEAKDGSKTSHGLKNPYPVRINQTPGSMIRLLPCMSIEIYFLTTSFSCPIA